MTSSVKMVKLISDDGEEFDIPINVAEQSELIKNMLHNIGDSSKVIPLDNLNSATLSKVIEYLKKHVKATAEDGKGAVNGEGGATEELKRWDAEFVKVDISLLFEIVLAAKYMDIKSLLDLGCQAIADNIWNKTPELLRRLFKVKNDFTPEEEAEIRKEYQWAFEDLD